MSVCFDGIGVVVATFHVEEGSEILVGDAVCLTGNGTVGLGASGGELCGVVLHVEEDGCASVQVSGFAQAAYTGTAPTVGVNELGVDGNGGVAVTAGGMARMVVNVDTNDETCFIKL